MIKLKLFLSIIGISLFLQAQNQEAKEAPAKEIVKSDVMSGYKLTDFPDFEKKWKMVTARFRRDTGEMRFTYANEAAFEALMKGVTDYPKGAIFAKIGFKTGEDISFPSSAVPSYTRRYQFMIRDKEKYKETDGWGYLLFDRDGYIFAEKPEIQQAACAACHRIVPERGFVFSEYLEFSPFKNSEKIAQKTGTHYTAKVKFKNVKTELVPEKLKPYFQNTVKVVRWVEHEITEFLFQGTLDEVKPMLSAEAVRSQKPAVFVSKDGTAFAAAFVENADLKCEVEGRAGYFIKAVSYSSSQKGRVYENRYCWPE